MSLIKSLLSPCCWQPLPCRPPPGMKLNDLESAGHGRAACTTGSRHVSRTEKPAPRWFRLSNGRQVNLPTGRWCCLCRGIALTVTSLTGTETAGTAVRLFRFSLHPGCQGDTAFPEALPVPPDVMQTSSRISRWPHRPPSWSTSTRLGITAFTGGNGCCRFYGADGSVLQMYGGKKGAK